MSKERSKIGKANRRKGAAFERKVRKDLEKNGWFVDKWTNTISPEDKLITPAKRKFNPYKKALSMANGFPDFVVFKKIGSHFDVQGVEVKTNGYLDKEEKEKCRAYLEQETFSKVLIAKPKKEGRRIFIEYKTFHSEKSTTSK